MTSGGNNFNDFPEIQLTKFRTVWTLLRQISHYVFSCSKQDFSLITSVFLHFSIGGLNPQTSPLWLRHWGLV